MSSLSLERILEAIEPYLPEKEWMRDPDFPQRVDLMRTRAVTLVELVQMLEPFYRDDFSYDPKGLEKARKETDLKPLLQEFTRSLSELNDWQIAELETLLRSFTEQKGIKPAVLIHPLRLAISGKTSGPGLFELLHAMGKENTVKRLEKLLSTL